MDIKNFTNKIHLGDCLDTMKKMPDNSLDAIVTDPPYGLSFMGKKWDYDVPSQEIWEEALRVLKPGGYLLAFAGTRTQHRMAVRIEDAGFEIRDMIAWVYGSGFPKSLNIGKAIDKLQGNEREAYIDEVFAKRNPNNTGVHTFVTKFDGTTLDGRKTLGKKTIENGLRTKGTSEWEGWGTALKPALEPITVARKPLSEKTVAENCLKWGTGGINIDGCRVGTEDNVTNHGRKPTINGWDPRMSGGQEKEQTQGQTLGRFPANLIHDGSDEVVGLFPNTKGSIGRANRKSAGKYNATSFKMGVVTETEFKDDGSASRFFYCAKASKSERNRGCEGLEEKRLDNRTETGMGTFTEKGVAKQSNHHPTVKPIALMEYLVKLVSRENAIVLDPFAGSGSTLIACKKLDRQYMGCEMSEEYIKIAEARLNAVEKEPDTLF